MSFRTATILKNYDFTNAERYPCVNYRFECAHVLENADMLEVYRVDKTGVEKIYFGPEAEETEFFMYFKTKMIQSLGVKGIVSGGHSIINLADKFSCGPSVVQSTRLAMKIIEEIQKTTGFEYDYLVQFNDLYIEHDTTRENSNTINRFRDQMFNPFIIPIQINEILKEYSIRLRREQILRYCTSKNLADKLKRYVKRKKLIDSRFSSEDTGNGMNWYYELHGRKILLLHNDKPNCAAGNVAMLRDIRYKVEKDKQENNYDSYIGIFPRCSKTVSYTHIRAHET